MSLVVNSLPRIICGALISFPELIVISLCERYILYMWGHSVGLSMNQCTNRYSDYSRDWEDETGEEKRNKKNNLLWILFPVSVVKWNLSWILFPKLPVMCSFPSLHRTIWGHCIHLLMYIVHCAGVQTDLYGSC